MLLFFCVHHVDVQIAQPARDISVIYDVFRGKKVNIPVFRTSCFGVCSVQFSNEGKWSDG